LTRRVVADAGPLIWLSRCGLLPTLSRLYQQVLVPPEVRHEAVDKGVEGGHRDADETKKAIEEGKITVERPGKKLINRVSRRASSMRIRLGGGEMEAIALALERDAVLLTNDEDARKVGESLGLRSEGTLRTLLSLVELHLITADEAREALSRMIEGGLWLTPRVVQRFHRLLDKILSHQYPPESPPPPS